jgi:hypothetical protein
MAGLTIDDVLKGRSIGRSKTNPNAKGAKWLLDKYSQPFPHKVYGAIAAIAMTEAREGKAEFSFGDIKAYALRAVAADGSEVYFAGERGFSAIEATDFPSQIFGMKQQLAVVPLKVDDLEAEISSELKDLERTGGIGLRMLAMDISDIARAAMSNMKTRKSAPYLELMQKELGTQRTHSYVLVLEGSRV